jgi:pimeloyl-ACP methyl ester carboxylesterase
MGWTTIPVGDKYTFHTWDEGDGTPLLYLHGFEGHPGDADFLKGLAGSHRIIAPELPGYGDSGGFEHIDDTLDMTLAIRQLIEAMGLDQVDVVGHSLGGMFAAELAAVSPHVVNRLVLVSPFGLWLESDPIPDPFVLNPTQLAEITFAVPTKATAVVRAHAPSNGNEQIGAALARTANLSVAGKFLWPIPDRGLRKRLPLIRAKTLIVRGEGDQLIPAAYSDAFSDAIPGASAVAIDNAGHYPMHEQPEEFARTCSSFLA